MSIPNIMDEVSTSELIKQLHQVWDKFHHNSFQNSFGEMEIRFVSIKVFGHVFNPEGLKGSTVHKVEGEVRV